MGTKHRKEWERLNHKLRKNHHLHHIIPIHMGGLDILDNIEEVSIKKHAKRHLELYKKYNKQADLAAYKFLNGLKEEGYHEICSLGGKKGGKFTVTNKLGIHGLSKSRKKKIARMGGKAAQKTLAKLKKCVFYNPELRLKANEKARQIQMETKTNAFIHCSREKQSERGKKGGPQNKGFIWLNNEILELKYTKKQQNIKKVNVFLLDNPNYCIGRLCETNKGTIAFSNSEKNRRYYSQEKYGSIENFMSLHKGYKRGYK